MSMLDQGFVYVWVMSCSDGHRIREVDMHLKKIIGSSSSDVIQAGPLVYLKCFISFANFTKGSLSHLN